MSDFRDSQIHKNISYLFSHKYFQRLILKCLCYQRISRSLTMLVSALEEQPTVWKVSLFQKKPTFVCGCDLFTRIGYAKRDRQKSHWNLFSFLGCDQLSVLLHTRFHQSICEQIKTFSHCGKHPTITELKNWFERNFEQIFLSTFLSRHLKVIRNWFIKNVLNMFRNNVLIFIQWTDVFVKVLNRFSSFFLSGFVEPSKDLNY